jgi:DNA gyrase subunit B
VHVPTKKKPEDPSASSYDASSIQVLKGLDGVRKRPGMYIGSTDSRGLLHCLVEIIDNSVDEAAAGFATRIDVTLNDDGSFSVADDGRGIPVDTAKNSKRSALELVFCELHAGGKFGGGGYGAAGGLHGVGASVVNALSSRLSVEVDRDGVTWAMDFRHGVPGTWDASGAFTAAAGVRKAGKVAKSRTGTRVTFTPDARIFEEGATVDLELLVDRARQIAFLVPGLTIAVHDHRDGADETSEFCFADGLVDFVEHLSSGDAASDVLHFTGDGTYTETVPVMNDDGDLVPTDVERTLGVDVAVRWMAGWDSQMRSFVNTIVTPKGGTHVTGFERAMVKVLNEALRDTKTLKERDDNVVKDDVLEGIVAVVKVEITEPQFEGQTKEVLGTSAAQSIVYQVVAQGLRDFFAANARRAKGKAILTKVSNAAKARIAARMHRETVRRKNAIESSTLPAKLADCRSRDLERSELLIVEGDSAGGSTKAARDSEFQAMLPLRGKILNVAKASPKQVFNNAEIAALISAMGAGAGQSFDPEQIRYGRVILATDADVDGAHIRVLLLTFFYHYMRPLLTEGRVFAAVPPLFLIKAGGDEVYAYSDAERDRVFARMSKGRSKPPVVQRFKGLGEMSAEQLAVTTIAPESRMLRRMNLSDGEAAAAMFDVLMGDAVEPRRQFIVTRSADIDLVDLDV